MEMQARRSIWTLVGAVAIVTLVLGFALGFHLDWASWAISASLTGFLGALALNYTSLRRVGDGRLGETLHEIALLSAYAPCVAALSYVLTAAALPLRDSELATIDASLGFDWPAWYEFVSAWPALESLLRALYLSSVPHILLVLLATGAIARTDRARELNRLLIATSLLMVMISALVPALCAWVYYGQGLEKAYHLAHVTALRDGTLRELGVGTLLGIVTFPSFHTAIAIILVWVTRAIAWLFWPTLLVNVGVLVSIPSEGGHHLIDIIAGALITALVIHWTRCRPRAERGELRTALKARH